MKFGNKGDSKFRNKNEEPEGGGSAIECKVAIFLINGFPFS